MAHPGIESPHHEGALTPMPPSSNAELLAPQMSKVVENLTWTTTWQEQGGAPPPTSYARCVSRKTS